VTELLYATNAYPKEFDATVVEVRHGGAHVAKTGEIGRVRITRAENKDKSNKRLEIALE
jgi:Ser-tRNA(Ala) deacylase AlaX